MTWSGWAGALGCRLRDVAPDRRFLKQDAVAALPQAVACVPDGMAAGVLAGVNPVYGLYASVTGPIAGGLTASTRMMVVATTSAAALAAGSTLSGVAAEDKPSALFLLSMLAGAAMIAAGFLRLGRYTRFVTHSVMIGFLTGISVNIILGQIPDLLGVSADGSTSVAKAIDAISQLGDADLATLLVGLGALALIVSLDRTPIRLAATVVALVIPTAVVLIAGLDSVAQVEDVGDIPSGFPLPTLPDFGLLSVDIIVGALAIAVITLVQGTGVSQVVPNPPDVPADPNRDFVAQGVANVSSGLFHGMPVGGSVGQSAFTVVVGAKTRWATILSGVTLLIILLVFSGIVGEVAMPTLAAVLVYAAYGSLRVGSVSTILRTNRYSQIALVVTFVATLLLPVAAAVAVGVGVALALQLNREALDLNVVERVRDAHGQVHERPVSEHLAPTAVTEIDVYGSLFYAGAQTLQARLPDPGGVENPVVVLRLRGRTSLGATFVSVVDDYADRLHDAGGRLYLSGVDPAVMAMLERTNQVNGTSHVRAFAATETVGESTAAATDAANTWLITRRGH